MSSCEPNFSPTTDRATAALNLLPHPIEVIDADGRLVYGNTAYSEAFLVAGKPLVAGAEAAFCRLVTSEDERRAILDRAAATGLWAGEIRVSGADGILSPFRLRVAPLAGEPPAPREFVLTYEDIRDEVQARESIDHQLELVAVRSRQAQMGELLSMIAHQWRQPLTVINSLVGNLQLRSQLGSVDSDYLVTKLDKMAQQVEYLSETIDSFRNFYAPSRFKSEEDLVVLVQRALELAGPGLEAASVNLDRRLPPGPWTLRVHPGELLQVVLELITNAREALETGRPDDRRLEITLTADPESLILEVANNGGDIPFELLPRIFEPYYSTKTTGGAGLGLYMARLIIEKHHGGVLAAESVDGWTRFRCFLPREVRA